MTPRRAGSYAGYYAGYYPLLISGLGLRESLSVTDCLLIGAALAFVGGDAQAFDVIPDDEDVDALHRVRELADVFKRGAGLFTHRLTGEVHE